MDIVEKALQQAAILHDGQYRQGDKKLPYVSHVVAVAFLAREYGGDDCVIAAALLHDTVEDTPYTVAELRADFGDRVADIVTGVSEDKSLPKPERKLRYIENLTTAPVESAFISACDLLHNLRSMVEDFPMADDRFREYFFTPQAIEIYTKRITVITGRLKENVPILTPLQSAFDEFKALVQ